MRRLCSTAETALGAHFGSRCARVQGPLLEGTASSTLRRIKADDENTWPSYLAWPENRSFRLECAVHEVRPNLLASGHACLKPSGRQTHQVFFDTWKIVSRAASTRCPCTIQKDLPGSKHAQWHCLTLLSFTLYTTQHQTSSA